jgi:hypothetical protein
MGFSNYLNAKAENTIVVGAAGLVQSDPRAALEIGHKLARELPIVGDSHNGREIFEHLSRLLAEVSEVGATELKQRYMDRANLCKQGGDRTGMYACSMISALYRRASLAVKGRQKDIDSFWEMSGVIANTIAAYRVSRL